MAASALSRLMSIGSGTTSAGTRPFSFYREEREMMMILMILPTQTKHKHTSLTKIKTILVCPSTIWIFTSSDLVSVNIIHIYSGSTYSFFPHTTNAWTQSHFGIVQLKYINVVRIFSETFYPDSGVGPMLQQTFDSTQTEIGRSNVERCTVVEVTAGGVQHCGDNNRRRGGKITTYRSTLCRRECMCVCIPLGFEALSRTRISSGTSK